MYTNRFSHFNSFWQSARVQSLLAALAALLAYGSWAAWSNHDFGMTAATKAFAAQGSFAFAATLTLTLIAASLYRRLGKTVTALAGAFGCCFVISATVPAGLHWFIGTPNIFQSILPGLIWGSVYLLSYLLFLHRTSRAS
ncbi:hypothetical protein [Reinekea marinisedimentorum]|uniref:hypothetical protein n=1 Tax=Reinekea marinisedimentorum TaxID=230495 RepID=UPI001050B71F|nr:hypothetical protein [Reinekea marinisedimentorum]